MSDINDNSPNKKKIKKFSAQEFRNQLKTDEATQALENYVQLMQSNSKQDCILEFLEKGGTCLEILQAMDANPNISPSIIFQTINEILLRIGAKYHQFQSVANETCRYLLNNYVTLINKMLSLSSTTVERISALKLLTTIVTFSTVFAKDILLHVNFNPTNIEMLTKAIEGKNQVREAFIHFLVAFLVDGHFPPLSVLLEKKGLLTSIINGMKYDRADVVVLVMTAMKNYILENPAVSKTVKMKTFSTPVVRDIVNLYNWKGPSGFQAEKKKVQTAVEVDELSKSKVNESVHDFLLVLGASHKFGVIFHDQLVGLGKKNQNSLMYTILESLDRPWDHSYAGDLVVKICGACPDQVRGQWANLKSYLEPRLTMKWLNAMNFAGRLIEELKPNCIEFAVKDLTVTQVSQIITILIIPLPIIKTIVPENNTYENQTIKYNVLKLLQTMLMQVNNYINQSKTWKNMDQNILKSTISNYITRNFPDAHTILSNWNKIDDSELIEQDSIKLSTIFDHLEVSLNILEIYKILAPHRLDSLSLDFDIIEFFNILSNIDQDNLRGLQVKVVKFLLDLEPNLFNIKSEIFDKIMISTLETYYNIRNNEVIQTLNGLLKNLSIFIGREFEINIWLDGVLNSKHFNVEIAQFLVDFLKFCEETSNFQTMTNLKVFCQNRLGKSIKGYLSFVILNIFHITNEVEIESTFLLSNVEEYINGWNRGKTTTLEQSKYILGYFQEYSSAFLEGDFQKFLQSLDLSLYPDFPLNLLQMSIFYLTNLLKNDELTTAHVDNIEILIQNLPANLYKDKRYLDVLLKNPIIVDNITIIEPNNLTTKFLLSTMEFLKNSQCNLDDYSEIFQKKLVSSTMKLIKKSSNKNQIVSVKIFEIFELSYENCIKILEKSSNLTNIWEILSYCLNRLATLKKLNKKLEPLPENIIRQLMDYFHNLIQTTEIIGNLGDFSSALYNYLAVFPCDFKIIPTELLNSIFLIKEYNKDILTLTYYLLEKNPKFFEIFEKNLEEICEKKGFILSLLDLVFEHKPNLTGQIFQKLEPTILKILDKPHKANQHFHNYYKPVGRLVAEYMSPKNFGKHIQKYQTAELFHVYLLKIIFGKIEIDNQILSNIILTFTHLELILLKQYEKLEPKKLENISNIFYEYLNEFNTANITDLSSVYKNEAFSLFCKLCLKYGVVGDVILIKILKKCIELCFEEDGAKLILDLMFSHSKFLDIVLNPNENRFDFLELWKIICMKWPQFMERNQVPVLLAAYTGTQEKSSKLILDLLKEYQLKAQQTQFFDFKPFLWGPAAASHYSVRSDIQKVLWRQPKMGDVLENLQESLIHKTIENPNSDESYDLDFFLPLFSHLLSPENPVQIYKFSKSGALSLTLLGLCNDNQNIRSAACHVLYRYHFHLEAKQTGKDNLLWIQFIEAICKGTALVEDYKINNFVGVFLARMAMILTQPTHLLYVPLSNYLTAKAVPDFKTIPELYTFLHSSDVNYKECRNFILQVIRDGCRNEKDFTVLMNSMGFKLISELCSSTLCDQETRFLILDIFKVCCKLPLGDKVLNGRCSFSPQIYSLWQLLG